MKLLSGEDLGAAFAAKGFEVVYLGGVHLIYPSMYRNDGTEFRQLMAQGLNSIMDDLDRQRGSLVNLVAGSSIGGLHAMMAFTLLKPRFAGWLAILPVTKLSALKEFVGIPNPRQFDPFAVADQLRGTKGYMSWGTADDRVDFRLTKALHELVASPGIHHLEYPGLGHETKEFLITDAVRWVDESF